MRSRTANGGQPGEQQTALQGYDTAANALIGFVVVTSEWIVERGESRRWRANTGADGMSLQFPPDCSSTIPRGSQEHREVAWRC